MKLLIYNPSNKWLDQNELVAEHDITDISEAPSTGDYMPLFNKEGTAFPCIVKRRYIGFGEKRMKEVNVIIGYHFAWMDDFRALSSSIENIEVEDASHIANIFLLANDVDMENTDRAIASMHTEGKNNSSTMFFLQKYKLFLQSEGKGNGA